MMTREETTEALMIIQAAYPNFRVPDKTITINTWQRILEDYTHEQVESAIYAFICSDASGFAPSIGQVVEKIQMIQEPEMLSEMEAWHLVYKAICNANYHAEEEFGKLPAAVQRAVGNPANLREWAAMDANAVSSVIQSHVMRSYRTVTQRMREEAKLPENMRKRLKASQKERLPSITGTQNFQIEAS